MKTKNSSNHQLDKIVITPANPMKNHGCKWVETTRDGIHGNSRLRGPHLVCLSYHGVFSAKGWLENPPVIISVQLKMPNQINHLEENKDRWSLLSKQSSMISHHQSPTAKIRLGSWWQFLPSMKGPPRYPSTTPTLHEFPPPPSKWDSEAASRLGSKPLWSRFKGDPF